MKKILLNKVSSFDSYYEKILIYINRLNKFGKKEKNHEIS